MAKPGLIEVYFSFDGNCKEALQRYAELFGGEITYLQQWKELPPEELTTVMPEVNPEHVMHASLKIGEVTLMGSDNPYMNTVFGDSVTLNWSHPDEDEVKRIWSALVADGATVNMELEPTFFSPNFGQLTDVYGINWQIMQWNTGA